MNRPVIPDHTLLRPIGRGAYGEVWLARNIMGTPRAVKVIWRQQFESDRPFEREFAGIQRYEPVSRSSGGLVHILHIGRNEAEGYFYYVMELADNASGNPASANPANRNEQTEAAAVSLPDNYHPRTLRSDLKRSGRLSTAECLRLAIDVSSGLGQLHRNGLVHRDVKPGNIIYVNGHAKLADIGLVTTEGEKRTFVGTEGYVPPEGPGSARADLYALGVVLYEASTGFSPERLPDVPAEWFSTPEGDQALELHEITLKACEGQRERRYVNADAMQAELALLQSGESVRHTRALRRRYARLRLSGLVGTSLLIVALGAAFFANYRARLAAASREKEARLRQQAEQAQANAENAEREARRQLQATLYEEARALVLSRELGHRTRALDALRQAAGSTNIAELRRVGFAALGLPDLRLEREMPLHGRLTFVRLDPKLERLAIGDGNGPVTIRSLPDLRLLATLPPTSQRETYGGFWSPDGRFLAVKRQYDKLGTRSDLEIWSIERTQLLFKVSEGIAFNAVSFHPRLPLLIAGHTNGVMSVWDLERLTETRPFRLPGTPCSLAYSPDGQQLATSYRRGSNWVVAFHDATSGSLRRAQECPEAVHSITWHPGGQWVGITGGDANEWSRGVWLLPVEGGPLTVLGQHKIKQSGLSFNPDGRFLMSCGWERETLCWDLQNRQRVFTCPNSGYDLQWSPDGDRCATVSRGTLQLQLYAFERPLCLELGGNRGERLGPGVFSPDGRFLALSEGQNICFWDLAWSTQPALVFAGDDPFLPIFSPDSSQLFAVAGRLEGARLGAWRINPEKNAPPQLTPVPLSVPPKLHWAGLSAGHLVLTSEEGVRFVSITNLASPDCRVVKIPPGNGTVSPDGHWLAVTYSFSPRITVYRLPEVLQVARLLTSNLVARVRFSPTSDELLVINRGGIEQWDTTTWQLKRRDPVSPVADGYVLYTPDGTAFWRATNFRDTALCARKDFEPILPLPSNLMPLALSCDGQHLAVSVDDRRVQVWDLVEVQKQFRALGLDWQAP